MSHTDGEAKFWMEPEIVLARNDGLSSRQVNEVFNMVVANKELINNEWFKHFGG